MAKREMVCPFSDKACKNCSLYIGRHYLLCDNSNYRGHVKNGNNKGKSKYTKSYLKNDFSVPKLEYIEELDLFKRIP